MWSWWDCMQWWSSGADGAVWPMFLPMILGPVIVLGAIVALIVFWARTSRNNAPFQRDRATPFDILRERFARGEIDRHEYEERKGLLSQS